MKLIRFGNIGSEKPGVLLTDGTRIDVSAFGEDYNEHFFGTGGIERLAKWLQANESSCPKVSDATRLGPPLTRPSKIVCVGLNYAQHAKEAGMKVPGEPVLFFKATSASVGPN
ncbi:MAG: fumarylacetoacetate hydrolase family protein, partial [Flavobacteriaceae bacterium]